MHQPIVDIKKPCHEVLENRKPGEAGNYCKSCRVTVTDFTGMSPDQISAYLLNHDVHCGTFNRKDVRSDSYTDKLISYLQSHRLKVAAVLFSLLILASCRVRRSKTVYGNIRGIDKHEPSIENLK